MTQVHSKASLFGASFIHAACFTEQTGVSTWQGIWLGEHQIDGAERRIVATLQGDVEI
ncbi:hypothetical protein AwEntero_26250 [Enterobacterales bacterium]|nr:hypothetical protein AwEntero_26250 [Enterobacterales bacterium]